MRRLSIAALTVLLLGSSAAVATACPLCKFGNEAKQSEDEPVNMRPRAYMYSILFMLAMPASMATALGVGIYKLNKHESNSELNDAE
jgi:hypothetical protein